MPAKAVFLDRDGVLIRDSGLITSIAQMELMPGVPQALLDLRNRGFLLPVVTNQAVIARGLATEEAVNSMNAWIASKIQRCGGPALTGFYVCPHHPKADIPAYRCDCDCRKPRPGLLLRAAAEWKIELRASFLIGDSISDIAAGQRVGCTTILVKTGQHEAALIESPEAMDNVRPAGECADLPRAAAWIRAHCGEAEAKPC